MEEFQKYFFQTTFHHRFQARNAKISPIFHFDGGNNGRICYILCVKQEYLPDIDYGHQFAFTFQASIAAERERGRGRLVDKEKEDFLTSSEKPQKRLKVSEQNLDADDPLGKVKAFIEIFYEKFLPPKMITS